MRKPPAKVRQAFDFKEGDDVEVKKLYIFIPLSSYFSMVQVASCNTNFV